MKIEIKYEFNEDEKEKCYDIHDCIHQIMKYNKLRKISPGDTYGFQSGGFVIYTNESDKK